VAVARKLARSFDGAEIVDSTDGHRILVANKEWSMPVITQPSAACISPANSANVVDVNPQAGLSSAEANPTLAEIGPNAMQVPIRQHI
jgi:hypothetical protein